MRRLEALLDMLPSVTTPGFGVITIVALALAVAGFAGSLASWRTPFVGVANFYAGCLGLGAVLLGF